MNDVVHTDRALSEQAAPAAHAQGWTTHYTRTLMLLSLLTYAFVPPAVLTGRAHCRCDGRRTVCKIEGVPTEDRRDILLVCHGPVEDASEVRVLAQCATASLHLQTGMREQTRFWLVLADRGFTLVCNGGEAQMKPTMGITIKRVLQSDDESELMLPVGWTLHRGDGLQQRLVELGVSASSCSQRRQEEERDQALLDGRLAAVRARNEANAAATAPPDDRPSASEVDAEARDAAMLEARLAALRARDEGPGTPLGTLNSQLAASAGVSDADKTEIPKVVMDNDDVGARASAALIVMQDEGERLTTDLLNDIAPTATRDTTGTVIVLCDEAGFTADEERCLEELAAVRARVSPRGLPLLASHNIVLAHAVLDSRVLE